MAQARYFLTFCIKYFSISVLLQAIRKLLGPCPNIGFLENNSIDAW